jgi:hypothetical protein
LLNAFIVVSILCVIDFVLLLIMPRLYFKIGVPIYNKTVEVSEGKSIDDVGTLVGIADRWKYRIENNIILYRTQFNFLNLYTFRSFSIIKGEFCLRNNRLEIVQRMNLTTVYFICLMIYTVFTQEIDQFGKVAAIIFAVLLVWLHITRNNEIKEIANDIQTTLN